MSAGMISYGSINRLDNKSLYMMKMCKGPLVANVNFESTELKKDLFPTS